MTITSKSGSGYPQAISKLQLRKLFLDCDANNDGILTKEEIKKAFHNLGALLPRYRAWEGLKHADANKDGCVSPEELDGLIDYAYKLQYTAIANY
ncbi:EF-hand domain - like 10 [Theobroma cacao]|uniref:Calcium-binding EF-hand family protein, putative n=1 Tax=Theobroma cacao TaxID=3641 RepID=A0A061FCN4_THECC|nr:Calcium-binding EF-hand family protein, putative [Theobroma cacao]WRX30611.1 EF-hand domain - like 10 [Theobroma cacao]